ncbi:MAG: hypothetical protein ACT4PL_09185 [Phycisphaerales bacterium]
MPFQLHIAALASCVVICAVAPALAQFSDDPGSNFALADRTGEQNQAKIRPRPDGGFWVTWYDNSVGGFRPTIQRLLPNGSEAFAHHGLTLANTTNSSTVDYDLSVDACGGALITFADNSLGASQITAMRISADGSRPWGATGVQLPGSASGSNPKITELSDGSIAVGWSTNGVVSLRTLSADGEPQGSTTSISESGRLLTLSDLEPGAGGTMIALWVRTFTTSFLSSKYLYAQCFDQGGSPQWAATPGFAAVCVYGPPQGGVYTNAQGGSIQNGYFPTMISDGTGGAVFAWYESAGPRNAYVQRIGGDGVPIYSLHGRPVSNTPLTLRLSASHAFDPATQDIFVGFSTSNTLQSQFGLRAQRVLSEGELGWGDDGIELLPLSTNQNSFTRVVPGPQGAGCIVACLEARSATTGVVQAFRLDDLGNQAWPEMPMPVCSTVSGKARLDAALSTRGVAAFTWGDGRSDSNDVYLQNVNPDGSYGPLPENPCAIDFNDDGLAEPGDLDDFITAFFGDCAARLRCDFNNDGLTEPGDLDDFLTAFFNGGC